MLESIQILKDCRKGCELLFIVTLLHLLQRNCAVKQAGIYKAKPFFYSSFVTCLFAVIMHYGECRSIEPQDVSKVGFPCPASGQNKVQT
jgi:hypothetical protein